MLLSLGIVTTEMPTSTKIDGPGILTPSLPDVPVLGNDCYRKTMVHQMRVEHTCIYSHHGLRVDRTYICVSIYPYIIEFTLSDLQHYTPLGIIKPTYKPCLPTVYSERGQLSQIIDTFDLTVKCHGVLILYLLITYCIMGWCRR